MAFALAMRTGVFLFAAWPTRRIAVVGASVHETRDHSLSPSPLFYNGVAHTGSTSAMDLGGHFTRPQMHVVYAAYGGRIPNIGKPLYAMRSSLPHAEIKLFVSPSSAAETTTKYAWMGSIAVVACKDLVPPYYNTRFKCYQKALLAEAPNAKVGMVDPADVWFKRDIFSVVTNGVFLAAEPAHHPMAKCIHHRQWIQGCAHYGTAVWTTLKANSMICAGTIFGTYAPLLTFLDAFVRELDRTGCVDQGVLNVLVYSGAVKVHVWKHEKNVVRSLNVAQTFNHEGAYVVHTGDNPRAIESVAAMSHLAAKALQFQNVLTAEEDYKLERLLRYIDDICTTHGIEYFIDGGTLIGALLHGGRIPWDDDLDVYFWEHDRHYITKLLETTTMTVQPSYNGLYSKLWNKSAVKVQNDAAHSWPFVDLGWLRTNNTHAWELRSAEPKYAAHKYPVYLFSPPRRVQYGSLMLNAPRYSETFLRLRHGTGWNTRCVKANWDHKFERIRDRSVGGGDATTIIPCSQLPWVPSAVPTAQSLVPRA
jgi:hypothetical protein